MVPAPDRDVNSTLTEQHLGYLLFPWPVLPDGDPRLDRLIADYEQHFSPGRLLGFRGPPPTDRALRELLPRAGAYRDTGQWPARLTMNWSYGPCELARGYL